jgi:flavodoxin
MKRIFAMTCLCLLVMAMAMPAQAQSKKTQNVDNMNEKKVLVAYFSATGTTEAVARTLAQAAKADLYQITPEKPYTSADLDWTNKSSRSTVEMKDRTSRPAIKGRCEKMAQYDVVFVGYPIWWGVAPTIVNTFLESYDFSGKTIVPFCTSGGSGIGATDKYLKPSCSDKTVFLPGKLIGSGAGKSELEDWVRSLKF